MKKELREIIKIWRFSCRNRLNKSVVLKEISVVSHHLPGVCLAVRKLQFKYPVLPFYVGLNVEKPAGSPLEVLLEALLKALLEADWKADWKPRWKPHWKPQ